MRQKNRINPLSKLVSVMWQHADGNKKTIVLYITLSVLSLIIWLLVPLVIAELIDAVQEKKGSELLWRAAMLLGGTVLMTVAVWALHGPSRVIETIVSFSIKKTFQARLLEKVTLLPVSWQQQHHSGELIDRIAKATTALGEFSETGFEVLRLTGQFIVAAAMLIWFMPFAGIIVASAAVLVVIAIIFFDRALVALYQKSMKGFNEVAASIQDYLTNITTIISLRLESRVVREVSDRTEKLKAVVKKTSITGESKWFVTSLIVDITRATTLFMFILLAVMADKSIEVGTLYILVEYLRTLGEAFFQFTWKYGDLLVKATRVSAVEHINEAFEKEVGLTAKAHLPSVWKKLEIVNLKFKHSEQERATLLFMMRIN